MEISIENIRTKKFFFCHQCNEKHSKSKAGFCLVSFNLAKTGNPRKIPFDKKNQYHKNER